MISHLFNQLNDQSFILHIKQFVIYLDNYLIGHLFCQLLDW